MPRRRSQLWLSALLCGCSAQGQPAATVAGAGAPAAVSGEMPGAGATALPGPMDARALAAQGGASGAPERRDASGDDASAEDAGPAGASCKTRITYGSAWIWPADHGATDYDEVPAVVTWDGTCESTVDGSSIATLSNGWRPVFRGQLGCVIALDVSADCAGGAGCATRVSYNSHWLAPADHAQRFDDIAGVVTTDGICSASGADSSLKLSNGWQPHFSGANNCGIGVRYTQCAGLFSNPVVGQDCPDPGVLRDGDQYAMVCTPGPKFPLRTSPDLVHWTERGTIFSAATRPGWAERDFWAPELHKFGRRYVVFFSARHRDGDLALGAASADNLLGPYTDLGAPLLRDPNPGVIDAHVFRAPDGSSYLLWKIDGNANRTASRIQIQALREDGLELRGAPSELLRNSLAWEGSVVEGPWMIFEAGYYYLFYSGNDYGSAAYALGVARSMSATEGFIKLDSPILPSSGDWAGPGHGSVVRTPKGAWAHVFHAWRADAVGKNPPGRQVLLAPIAWGNGWPTMWSALSALSRPPF